MREAVCAVLMDDIPQIAHHILIKQFHMLKKY
jgi:hypothetical protein